MKYAMVPAACKAFGLPEPEAEYKFHPTRKWRLDFSWPSELVALEIEGGVFMKGGSRHSRGAGFKSDLEKYNTASAMGWVIFRVMPEQLQHQQTYEWLQQALARRPHDVLRDSEGKSRPRVAHDGGSYDDHQVGKG